MREEPKELQVYRHFKGNMYQIVAIAIHTETEEKLVIYRALYGDLKIYARPLSMFLSEVDSEKYPNAQQKYRFELMGADNNTAEKITQENNTTEKSNQESNISETIEQDNDNNIQKTVGQDNNVADVDEENIDPDAPVELDPLLERFLDADSYEAKLDVFYLMKRKGTMQMLSYVATSLDIEVSKEDFDEQYQEILNCLKTMVKYECNRLRP